MDRDLRETPLYKQVEEHFRKALGPAFGRISVGSDPRPSPDGRFVAFTGTRLEKLEGAAQPRVCLVDLEEGRIEEVTHGPNTDSMPRWSPDGRRLAFLSDRDRKGLSQLYVLDLDRIGEARPGPVVEGTVEYLNWSPDGTRVLLGNVGFGGDRGVALGSGIVEAEDEDEDEDRPSWLPVVQSPEDSGRWRRLHVADLESGEARQASREGLNVWEAVWCGPETIAAVVSEDPEESAWFGARVALLDPATGEERIVYSSGRGDRQVGLPAASPSGRRLAVVQALASDRGFVAGDLVLIDPETGEATAAETLGADVTDIAWRDEGQLFFAGQRGLDTVAGEVDAESLEPRELWAGTESLGSRDPQGAPLGDDAFVAFLESFERPPELAVFRNGKPETVASFAHDGTRYLSEVAGRLERVSWTAPDGTEIEGFLTVPEEPGPHPLVAFVHGGPIGRYQDHWSMGYAFTPLLVSRGYAVFQPNPRGSTGRGQGFAELVVGDMGGGDAADVLAGIDALVERGVADPERLGVLGGSYGGFMAAWLPTQTDRFAASVSLSPVTDWYSEHWDSNIGRWDREFLRAEPTTPGGPYFERSPVMFASRVRTPMFLTAGLVDRCTPPGQAWEMFRALREHGVPAEIAVYPEEGHGVRTYPAFIDWCARTVGWFERWMPAREGKSSA
ncbi:MAG TPA: S9 family peptidase [Actinomycetota bacterium]|nr:S9 family peptidase [Actinomycetota bacterium]